MREMRKTIYYVRQEWVMKNSCQLNQEMTGVLFNYYPARN